MMKRWFKIFFLCGFCSLIAVYFNACASGSKAPAPQASAHQSSPDSSGGYQYYDHHTIQVTTAGENSQGVLSPDMSTIYFVSWNRPEHAHSQIYALDLKTKTERRISHHDGKVDRLVLDRTGQHLLYASTTDELKENPLFIKKMLAEYSKNDGLAKWKQLPTSLPPYEVYTSKRDGNQIKRLTHSIHFDAEADWHHHHNFMIFSSLRTGIPQLFLQYLQDGRTLQLTNTKDAANHWPAISPSGKKLVWSRHSLDGKKANLILADWDGKNETELTKGNFQHQNPSWHPLDVNTIIFSANLGGEDNYDLYTLHIQSFCLKKLTFTNKYSESHPRFSPDGKSILFTSNAGQVSQIYLMKYNPPAPCIGEVI